MHDFRLKLSDPRTAPSVRRYLDRARRSRSGSGPAPQAHQQEDAPISINLDLTLACDYRCGHCIDSELLNGGKHLSLATVRESLRHLAAGGLRSVILIGGGEPALHPQFGEIVAEIKSLRLQCAIVSNGAHNGAIARVAHLLDAGDWVRLSLDAGSEETFQALHRPRNRVTLDHICRTAAHIKERAPQAQLGYSFVVMWRSGGQAREPAAANVGEMPRAAARAKGSGFDYISFKPMLARDARRAEVVNLGGGGTDLNSDDARAIGEIRRSLACAQAEADTRFRVVPSRNLMALLDGDALGRSSLQPRTCHMQQFRHVLTPLGVFACPAHRGNPRSRFAGPEAYADPGSSRQAVDALRAQIERFDAASECRGITCIYNEANWWLDGLVASGGAIEEMRAPDLFL